MRRNALVLLGIAVVLLLAVSCAGTRKTLSTVDYSSPVYSGVRGESPVYTYTVLDESLRNPAGVYTIPFTENVVEVAKETGTMRIYFMSGEKYLNATGADAAYMGDSTLLVFPDGQTMLIDAGRPEYAPVLVENLRRLGIEKLDYVMLSHMHIDHYGSLWSANGVLANFPVDTFIWNGSYNTSQSARTSFEGVIQRRNIKLMQVKRGDSFSIGDVRVDIYNPDGSLAGQHVDETHLNNSSIAAKFTYGDFKSLFCGDLYVLGEWNVIENAPEGALDVDLAKANHHGRDSSTSVEWAEATKPRVVFSATQPMKTTYTRYSKVGARVYTEYMDDYVRVVTDGYNCEVTASAVRLNDPFAVYNQLVEKIWPGTF
ncbi:MAG: MBL fold metallo-hydrolase [Spirochaetales bacterium]|nr:MBL fold metallo-hydrolase [Spirochaetales bacterium]